LLANAKKPAEGAKIQTQHSYYKAYAAFQQQFGYLKRQLIEKLTSYLVVQLQ
jgi:hypothetical protein